MVNALPNRKISWLALVFCVAFVFCTVYLAANPHLLGGSTPERIAMNLNMDNGWTTKDGTPVNLSNLKEVPGFADNGISVFNGFPREIESGAEFNFVTKNATVRVYYDDVLAYAHDPDPNVFGNAYATHFVFAPLSPQDASKVVRIDIRPAYKNNNNTSISNLRISGTVPYIQSYVRSHGIPLLESALIVFTGLTVIVLHIMLRNRRYSDLDLLSLGTVSVLLGLWSGAVTSVVQLVAGLNTICGALEYMSLLFVPYPIVRFAGSLLRPRHRDRYEKVARFAAVFSVSLTLVLAVLRRLDMHQLLPITHAQLVLCGILIAMQAISSFRRYGRRLIRGTTSSNRAIMIAFLAFAVCASTDFVLFNLLEKRVLDSAFFLRHGLFAFSVVLAIEAFRTSMSFMRRAEKAEAVEAVAYIDALTGIGNRTAWKIMRGEMEEALANDQIEDALVCQFDVNYLKKVNDTYGHNAGDDLIKRAADTINHSFGTEGACYRTGGDEFTALLVGIVLDERLHVCYDLYLDLVDEQNAMETMAGDVPLSMAMGFAKVSETSKHTIKAAMALADKRMYVNKHTMKAERKD